MTIGARDDARAAIRLQQASRQSVRAKRAQPVADKHANADKRQHEKPDPGAQKHLVGARQGNDHARQNHQPRGRQEKEQSFREIGARRKGDHAAIAVCQEFTRKNLHPTPVDLGRKRLTNPKRRRGR